MPLHCEGSRVASRWRIAEQSIVLEAGEGACSEGKGPTTPISGSLTQGWFAIGCGNAFAVHPPTSDVILTLFCVW